MQDLRLRERRDHTLILETEDGNEFILEVTEEVFATVQSIHRAQQSKKTEVKVRPREVQTLLREGVARDEVAERLDIDRESVDRYAGPIEAEFAYILEQALGVQVRADAHGSDDPQFFGEVIEERLEQLQTDSHGWSTWRHPEEGWMVLLTFTSHGVDHEAQWSFEHRKRLLSPITPDAVNLSKQGDVGDKLIPTLRAVDRPDEKSAFDSEPFDQAAVHDQTADTDVDHDPLPEFTKSDFERRLGIEQRAIVSEPEPQDLGQTSDLLDALRKRRQDRDAELNFELETDSEDFQHVEPLSDAEVPDATTAPRSPINIWSPPSSPEAVQESPTPEAEPPTGLDEPVEPEETDQNDRKLKKGRQSIPSWDEILFGTRSEED